MQFKNLILVNKAGKIHIHICLKNEETLSIAKTEESVKYSFKRLIIKPTAEG